MKRNVAEASSFSNPEILEEHPHYAHRLVDLMLDEWQPTPDQYELLVNHLAECIHCQVALGTLVVIERDNVEPGDSSSGLLEQLLSLITKIIHETKARDEITAYIEILEVKGEKQAKKKFPQFFEHLKLCKACQIDVAETRDLLRRAKEDGLIAPPTPKRKQGSTLAVPRTLHRTKRKR